MKPAIAALLCVLLVAFVACTTPRGTDASLPAFVATAGGSGEIKVWGSPADGKLLEDWEAGFRKFHPDARIMTTLHGPDSTMAGIYTGVSDIAFMAREIRQPVEQMAFAWVHHYPPFSVEVANGGLTADRPSENLAFVVHQDNPLAQLSLSQIDAVFGAEHLRGQENIRHWGGLGLEEAWTDRPIHVYGPVVDSASALFIRNVVLKGSAKWNRDYREEGEDGVEVVAKLAEDPDGIGFVPYRAVNDRVKVLALAAEEKGPFVPLTAETVAVRTYPLARTVTMVIRRPPQQPIEPKIKEFLRYVLSREGQAAVARDGAYGPLGAASLRAQIEKLD